MIRMMTERDGSVAEIRENLDEVLTGGNHLACVLIGRLGAGAEFPDYKTPSRHAEEIIKDSEALDVWFAWRAIMRMRDRLMEMGIYE